MNANTRTVVLVDPIITGSGYLEATRTLGVNAVRVFSQPQSYYRNLPKVMQPIIENFPNVIWHQSLQKTENDIRKITRGDIQGVVSGFETAVELADQLATIFNVPSNVIELSQARRNKDLMKEAVRSKELKTAKYRIGDTKADLKIAVSELCLPVVVKTPRGCGSNLVEICRLVEENRPIPITKDSWSNPFFCLLSHRDPKIIETDTAKIRKLFRLEIGGN